MLELVVLVAEFFWNSLFTFSEFKINGIEKESRSCRWEMEQRETEWNSSNMSKKKKEPHLLKSER